jgi:DNA polymerase III delta prime subunit
METIRASAQKLRDIVDPIAKKKYEKRQSQEWCHDAKVSMATLKRFWRGIVIEEDYFIDICKALGIENWKEIVDQSPVQQKAQTGSFFDYDGWVGRVELLKQLNDKFRDGLRVLLLTGITGIGKTALADRLAVELQGSFPESVTINLDHLQSKGNFSESIRTNSDHQQNRDFASVAAQLLIGWGETLTPDDLSDSQRLLDWVVSHLQKNRYLLIIDSLEFILASNSDFQDQYWQKFFHNLLSADSCESRIILTSQDLPRQLATDGSRYHKYWHCEPLKGFTNTEQSEFFRKAGLNFDKASEEESYLKRIGAAYEGHPLALRVIAGEIINNPFNGNVVAYWKKYGHEVEEVEQSQQQPEIESENDDFRLDRYTRSLQKAVKKRIEATFERLAKDFLLAYLILCYASVYRHPVPESFYFNILQDFNLDEEQQYVVLDTLQDRYLIEVLIDDNNDFLLRQHNLIRSVAQEHLKKWKNEKKVRTQTLLK